MKELENIEKLIDSDWEQIYKEAQWEQSQKEKEKEKEKLQELQERGEFPSIAVSFKEFVGRIMYDNQYNNSRWNSLLFQIFDETRKTPKSFERIWNIFFSSRARKHEMVCRYCTNGYDIFVEEDRIDYNSFYEHLESNSISMTEYNRSILPVTCFKCGHNIGSIVGGKIIAITAWEDK